ARHPLFQVMLALQNLADLPEGKLELADLSVTPVPVDTATAKFDLSLDLKEQRAADGTPAGIHGTIEYATDLFDRASIEALAGWFVRLVEAAVADPEQPIGRLDILDPAERHTILRQWNDTAHSVPSATLPQLFEAQVARSPEAIAVVCEEHSLSYG